MTIMMTSMTTRTITEEYDRIEELAQQPTVKLLDEPTASLDVPTRVEITGRLKRLSRTTGMPASCQSTRISWRLRN